jgi:hypothetical protein
VQQAPDPILSRSFGPTLFQLAFFASGDRATAGDLAGAALRESPGDGPALRQLAASLPERRSDWPRAGAQHAAALGLHVDAAERMLATLGELDPLDRLALALNLVMGVPRHDLASWLGTQPSGERVAQAILEIGQMLGLVPEAPGEPLCQAITPQLADVDDPQSGRGVRLHLLGCAHCGARVAGIRHTHELLRRAIQLCFPAQAPAIPVVEPPAPRRRPAGNRRLWQLGGTSTAVLLAAVLLVLRPVVAPQALVREKITAASLLDRALNRLEPGARSGVLHERYRAGEGADAIVGERWIEYQAPQRMRLTIERAADHAQLLDLATDGQTRLRYTARGEGQSPSITSVDDPRVQELLPLLRQLSSAGAIGSFPAPRMPYDMTLIGAAKRSNPVLLGTTRALDRPAYLLTYTEPGESRRVVLTIDGETAGLLRATAASTQANGPATTLWQAEVVEIVPEAPPHTLDVPADTAASPLPNPRHLLVNPFSNLTIAELAQRYVKLPVPATSPAGTALAYLRGENFYGAIQLYEGTWTSVAVVTPFLDSPVRAEPPLGERTGAMIWRAGRVDTTRGLTQIVFAPAGEPLRRSYLYLWHAYLPDAERLEQAKQIIQNIRWLDSQQMSALEGRFVAPLAGSAQTRQPGARGGGGPR